MDKDMTKEERRFFISNNISTFICPELKHREEQGQLAQKLPDKLFRSYELANKIAHKVTTRNVFRISIDILKSEKFAIRYRYRLSLDVDLFIDFSEVEKGGISYLSEKIESLEGALLARIRANYL